MADLQSEEPFGSQDRDERFVSAERLAVRQWFHFLIWTAVPFLAVVCWFISQPHVTAPDIILFLVMWIFTGCLGISLGFHRYYTHRSFDAHPSLQIAMAAAGSMAAQGPITYWVTVHRCHHQHSDREEDPHSPRFMNNRDSFLGRISAFFHGHIGWVVNHDVPVPRIYAHDLRNNRIVRVFDRTYWVWAIVGIALPGAFVFLFEPSLLGFLRGCVFGGFLRILIGSQIIWAINSVCHTSGARRFETRDDSANNWALAVPSFGEGWHNNHHAFPWSARFGLAWWQVDLGWIALCCLNWIGLVSHLKHPSVAQVSAMAKKVSQSGTSHTPASPSH